MQQLSGQVAVITGGASGIGASAVAAFAHAGASIAIWDVNQEKGLALVDDLIASGKSAAFFQVNTAQAAETSKAAQETLSTFGRIDILINNAGITRDATLLKMTPEQWQQVIDVNLTGVFNCTQAVAPAMIAAGKGSIINTSSVVALYGNFGQTNYVAAKSAVIGMTKVWARELGRKGIRVNAVAPGFIATEMITTVPEKVIDGLLDRTPLQRLGKPEDIAKAYLFLASDDASFITGHCLSVDGGITI
jgi:3-oxoacyl-[acyl-carrier protein] reductase